MTALRACSPVKPLHARENSTLQFGVVSWNTNRLNFDRLTQVLTELVRVTGLHVYAFQDILSWPVDPCVAGWTVLHADGCASALLIPSCYEHLIRWQHNSERTSSVLLGDLGVISAYLADSGKSMDEFENSIIMSSSEIRRLL